MATRRMHSAGMVGGVYPSQEVDTVSRYPLRSGDWQCTDSRAVAELGRLLGQEHVSWRL